jgi:hypothetical protein
MSFVLMKSAIAMPLPPARRMVLVQLARMANQAGVCWPSVQTIARQCCLSVRCVFGHLAQLAKAGLIQRRPRTGRSTVYTVTVATSDQAAADPTSTSASDPALRGVVLDASVGTTVAPSVGTVSKDAVVPTPKPAAQPVAQPVPQPLPEPSPAPKPKSAPPSSSSIPPALPTVTLGRVVQAMRAVGLLRAEETPGLAALVATASDEREFTEAAGEAVKRGKGFAWALARVAGKRKDAASTPAPAKPDRDPVLIQIERDVAQATPPPAKVQEQLAQLRAKLLDTIHLRKAGMPLT